MNLCHFDFLVEPIGSRVIKPRFFGCLLLSLGPGCCLKTKRAGRLTLILFAEPTSFKSDAFTPGMDFDSGQPGSIAS